MSRQNNKNTDELKKAFGNEWVDFHSHILPGMDDGSESLEMTEKMLLTGKENGICTIVATPHFYPTEEDPDLFLERRAKCAEELKKLYSSGEKKGLPEIYLGAEVAYFPGIGKSRQMPRLCIQGTNLILVEMPFEKWKKSVIDDVVCLKMRQGLQPIIAHFERYISYQSPNAIKKLVEEGLFIQTNASSMLTHRSASMVMRQIKKGNVHLFGSDCHNCDSRPENLEKGLNVLFKKKYFDYLQFLKHFSKDLLSPAEPFVSEQKE